MIAPQDLRIGNWVLDEDGKMSSVKSINDRTVGLHTTFYAHSSSYKTIFPLPLTPEILEKCGFVKDGFDTYNIPLVCNLIATEKTYHLSFSGDYLYIRQGRGGGSLDDMVTVWNKDIMRVFYLHQLQNIVHALTNTELTITI